jgi:hypothetical protein
VAAAAGPGPARTPARRKTRQLAKYRRAKRPDYAYLKEVFRHLREELGVEVTRAPKNLPYVPTEAEIRAFYDAVWKARRANDVILKTQGIDDALIQPYSGHATRQSQEIYSRLALAGAQQRYDDVIGDFPV